MAVQKNIIKADHLRAVVHLWASAAGDSSIITLNELMSSDETSSSSIALSVSIANAYSNSPSSADSSITVRRGSSSGTVVLDLHGFTEFPGGQHLPAIALDSTSSIFVAFEAPGMLILDLRKLAGFNSPNYNVGV
jgi:hypothetical protein